MISAAKNSNRNSRFFFASSATVPGIRHDAPTPRHADEAMEGTDNYAHSKVACERELRESSGLRWTVLRVGTALPLDMLDCDPRSSLATSFGTPLEQRMDFIHPADIATAVG